MEVHFAKSRVRAFGQEGKGETFREKTPPVAPTRPNHPKLPERPVCTRDADRAHSTKSPGGPSWPSSPPGIAAAIIGKTEHDALALRGAGDENSTARTPFLSSVRLVGDHEIAVDVRQPEAGSSKLTGHFQDQVPALPQVPAIGKLRWGGGNFGRIALRHSLLHPGIDQSNLF